VAGARERADLAREDKAWQIAWQIAPHLQRAKQPQDILGRPTVEQVKQAKRERRKKQ
jgi:hypothetical protein